jgi:phosphonate transport system substrate-binding protein
VTARPLRVATHLAPGVLPAYALAARRIGEALGRPAELIVAADYRRCLADADHVCFVCSIPYILLAREHRIGMEPVAAPILRGERYGGRPVYTSEAVVLASGPHRSFEDLAGARWAFNEPFSHSGFVVALHELVRRGLPATFLGEWVEAGFHDDAIQMVLDGRADWAAIDSQVLDIWRRSVPTLRRRLRTVAVLGPSTIQPVVASTTRLTDAQRGLVRDALLRLHEDALGRSLLRGAGITRFISVTDADYADIRTMLAAVESAGLLPAWWWPRWERIARRRRPALSLRRSPERAQAAALPPPPRPRRSSPRPSPPRS